MQRLIARESVLYGSILYKPGDELPTNNTEMVNAWLRAKTAAWDSTAAKVNKAPVDDKIGKTSTDNKIGKASADNKPPLPKGRNNGTRGKPKQ